MEKHVLDIDINGLQNILKDFYILTKIRIAVFNTAYEIICSYPNEDCQFCKLVNSCEEGCKLCIKSNRKSFEKCSQNQEICIYHCHAGLIEATTPIINEQGIIIGYLMFGQITDIKDRDELTNHLQNYLSKLKISGKDAQLSIKYKSQEQVKAAAKIMETCTLYLLNKNLIKISKKDFVSQVDSFIERNIGDNLTVKTLATSLGYSRTSLYTAWNSFMNVTIAEYIKQKRIEKAKWYLNFSKEKIDEISSLVGFNDYNYFCRIFKKETGIPAKKYRKLNNQN